MLTQHQKLKQTAVCSQTQQFVCVSNRSRWTFLQGYWKGHYYGLARSWGHVSLFCSSWKAEKMHLHQCSFIIALLLEWENAYKRQVHHAAHSSRMIYPLKPRSNFEYSASQLTNSKVGEGADLSSTFKAVL